MIKQLSANDHLPGYSVRLDANDLVRFQNREVEDKPVDRLSGVPLREETYLEAKELTPGWDIYMIEDAWRAWSHESLQDADASFLGFCRQWYANRGAA